MHKYLLVFLLFFIITAAWPLPSYAVLGARLYSLGGTLAALDDDGNALFLNPAGTHSQSGGEIAWIKFAGSGNLDFSGKYSLGMDKLGTITVGWIHNPAYKDWAVSYGTRAVKPLALGASVKFIEAAADPDSNGMGFDAGFIFYLSEYFSMGLMIKDISGTKIYSGDTLMETRNQRFYAGLSFIPSDNTRYYIDFPDGIKGFEDVSFGAESALSPGSYFRVGCDRQWVLGAGIVVLRRFHIDYSYNSRAGKNIYSVTIKF